MRRWRTWSHSWVSKTDHWSLHHKSIYIITYSFQVRSLEFYSWVFFFYISGSLVDKKGKILVPGIYNDVAPLTEEEKKLYEKIDFDLTEYCKDVGAGKLLHDTKASNRLMMLLLTRGEMCCLIVGFLWVFFVIAGTNPNASLEVPVSFPSRHRRGVLWSRS